MEFVVSRERGANASSVYVECMQYVPCTESAVYLKHILWQHELAMPLLHGALLAACFDASLEGAECRCGRCTAAEFVDDGPRD